MIRNERILNSDLRLQNSKSAPSAAPYLTPPQSQCCACCRLGLIGLTLALLFSSFQPLAAQEKLLPVFHFQKLSGLFNTQIRSRVVRDQEGFVWIGTLNGLERFDGYSVKDYRNIAGDPFSLSSNYIPALLVDKEQRLWVGTYDTGLSLYDRATDRFFNLLPRPDDTSWYQAKTIAGILEDRDGNLWLASRFGGVVRMELPAEAGTKNPDSLLSRVRFTTYPLGTAKNSATDLCEGTDGTILVASDSGLIVLDPSTHSLTRLHIKTLPGRLLDSAVIQCFCRDTSNILWIGTEAEGLFRIDWRHRRVENFRHARGDSLSLLSDNIQDIARAGNGNLWIGSDAGLQLFSPGTGQRIPYLTAGPAPRGTYMTMLSVDGTGTLWMGAVYGSVHWLSPRSQLLPNFGLRGPDGISPSPFATIERDREGNTWVSSYKGKLFQIDVSSRTVRKVIDVLRGKKTTFENYHSFIDRNGTYWFGAWGLGLFRVDLTSGKVWNYGIESGLGTTNIAKDIAQASGDSLWIAAHYDGLKRFDPVTGRFSEVSGFPEGEVWSVMRDRRGMIWVTSVFSGITILDPLTGATEALRHNPMDDHSLSSDHGRAVYEDPMGRVWIGTGNMINLWDHTAKRATRYPNPEFNTALFATPLCSDAKGRLWVYFLDGGVSVLDPQTGTYTNFDESDGYCSLGDNMAILEDGRALIAGFQGLNIFHPDSLDRRHPAPPLVLTRMLINDIPTAPPVLSNAWSLLELPYVRNVLEFEFAAIEIDAPDQVRYQYQLEGFEEAWVKARDHRYVRYTNLSPGDYVFRVRAASSRGEWPDQEIALAVRIFPPWWRTWWAYGGYGSLFVLVLFSGYRLRLKQVYLKQRAEMEHFQAEHLAEVDRIKSRFFANISHEFRTPLTLILGPAEQAANASAEPAVREKLALVTDNAHKLLGLVNQLLDFSRLDSGMIRLQVSNDDLAIVLRRIVLSFGSWAERKKITLQFRPDREQINAYVDIGRLEQIVNNLMSNALKFTPDGGRIDVRVDVVRCDGLSPAQRSANEAVVITVADTGIGLAAEKLPRIFDRFYRVDESNTIEGTGIGLALTKELVDLHHGTIAVKSTPAVGSVFTVTIPIGYSAYLPEEMAGTTPQSGDRGPFRHEASSNSPGPIPATPPAEGKPTVLVVEDNGDLRSYIRGQLDTDYAVLEAENGRRGYDGAVESLPDLVISDVMMPEMDGIELCRRLKQDVRTSHIPVILLTARADTDSKIEGLGIGADDYVTKPFDSRELAARVRNLIEQRRHLRTKFWRASSSSLARWR